ncbi:hypothetical protein BKA66DRAFT_443311 [Pyrenochaeta sp. MPI-SDFR-AT-0127]|nr:hypothetical protein BKA66DRAFT_443311 [Pyrenochaeta sp. MPI-SDFR-AT-0127]
MHSNTLVSVVIAAIGIFATTTSAACTIKFTTADCCFRDAKARTSQDQESNRFLPGQGITFATGDLCSNAIKATCGANCCSMSTGQGIGCPKPIFPTLIDVRRGGLT